MRLHLALILVFAASCATTTSAPSPAQPRVQESVDESPGAGAEPAAARTAPKELYPCPKFDDDTSFRNWRERLIGAINTNDLEGAKKALQCADPSFSGELLIEAAEWVVDASPRHLDADPADEWVLLFRQSSRTIGHGERVEFVWLAVFDDKRDGLHKLAGTVVRPKLDACVLTDSEGVQIEYGPDTASEDAAFTVVEQKVAACGTQVDVSFTKTEFRIQDGKLVAFPMAAPKRQSWNRTKKAQ